MSKLNINILFSKQEVMYPGICIYICTILGKPQLFLVVRPVRRGGGSQGPATKEKDVMFNVSISKLAVHSQLLQTFFSHAKIYNL